MRRRKPSCVRRENPIIPACCSHQRLAIAAWTCSGAASASHTLISGKLNEFISLFVGDTDTPPGRADQWRIEIEPPARPSRFGFFHGTLDPRKNELSRRAALSSSSLVDPAVKLAGQVNRGTDRIGFHIHRLCADDLNKSIAPEERRTCGGLPQTTCGMGIWPHTASQGFMTGTRALS